MDDYFKANAEHWDQLAAINVKSDFYNVKHFKEGTLSLLPIEREELGDVAGRSLLHLQCHFGLDTLSWARLGARVTGVDLSGESIRLARSLAAELDIEARFIQSNIYHLPDRLDETFDLVFTSYGVLCWLPDLKAWAELIARYLKPGGTFYMVELHPFVNIFNTDRDVDRLEVRWPYFAAAEPERFEPEEAYADRTAAVTTEFYEWDHTLGAVLNALIGAGLKLEFLHEFPTCCYDRYPFMEKGEDGLWRMKKGTGEIPGAAPGAVPLMFSVKAVKEPS